MLVNHANLNVIFTGFKSTFQRGFELATPNWNEVAMEIPSDTEKEEYDWLGVAPQMREWLGDRVIESLGTHGFTIPNRDWELTVGVERNKIEDDRFGVYTPFVQRMGESAALHPDSLVYGLLNDGATAGNNSYDGVPFFSAAHPHEDLGVVSNIDSGGAGPNWYLMDLSSVIKPLIYQSRKAVQFVSKMSMTDDNVFFAKEFLMGADARYNVGYGLWQQAYRSNQALNEANFESAWEAMTAFTSDSGNPLNIMPTALVVPTSLQFDAKRLIEKQLVSAGETNIHAGSVRIIMNKFLSNTP